MPLYSISMRRFRAQVFGWLFLLLAIGLPAAGAASEKPACVLISREIAPYIAMVEGLEDALGNQLLQRYFLNREGQPYTLAGPGGVFDPRRFSVLVAVGPEALRFLHGLGTDVPLVYAMVLNPGNVVGSAAPDFFCGVTLNLSAATQIFSIRRHFPDLNRLGVLFDPVNNQDWFDQAADVGRASGIELIPLRVHQVRGRVVLPADFQRAEAILFIPDRSIISQTVIRHVIKEAALHGIPIVGYNQFFHDAGAALSIVVDYRGVGGQVARQVEHLLAGKRCEGELPPAFAVHINGPVWKALGIGAGGRP